MKSDRRKIKGDSGKILKAENGREKGENEREGE